MRRRRKQKEAQDKAKAKTEPEQEQAPVVQETDPELLEDGPPSPSPPPLHRDSPRFTATPPPLQEQAAIEVVTVLTDSEDGKDTPPLSELPPAPMPSASPGEPPERPSAPSPPPMALPAAAATVGLEAAEGSSRRLRRVDANQPARERGPIAEFEDKIANRSVRGGFFGLRSTPSSSGAADASDLAAYRIASNEERKRMDQELRVRVSNRGIYTHGKMFEDLAVLEKAMQRVEAQGLKVETSEDAARHNAIADAVDALRAKGVIVDSSCDFTRIDHMLRMFKRLESQLVGKPGPITYEMMVAMV